MKRSKNNSSSFKRLLVAMLKLGAGAGGGYLAAAFARSQAAAMAKVKDPDMNTLLKAVVSAGTGVLGSKLIGKHLPDLVRFGAMGGAGLAAAESLLDFTPLAKVSDYVRSLHGDGMSIPIYSAQDAMNVARALSTTSPARLAATRGMAGSLSSPLSGSLSNPLSGNVFQSNYEQALKPTLVGDSEALLVRAS